ncbi:hypothetical protein PIB30_026110 [Stylosanthes scabra]|uniref:Uncharacterized protein n=1 Tax=Stylosanthes scabra TaxID=79078 RepID=A0ABU6T9Y2_9FABA|nr:hypothetical protein [Stylosanthes scabra]
MGRAPCCDKANVKRGPWSPEEDSKLKEYINKHGTGGNWIALPQKAGLKRCGKSCRLRWLNYLRPNIKHGEFSEEEDRIICSLYVNIGSRWSIIAAQLPGRTDNDIKNYWNTKLKKKLISGFLPPNSSSSINNQRKQQQAPFPSSSSSSMYMDQYYGTGLVDPISLPSTEYYASTTTTTNSVPFYYNQVGESIIFSPSSMQQNYQMFVGSEAATSCSSSDNGSSIKQEEIGYHHQGSYNNIAFNSDHHHEFLVMPTSSFNNNNNSIVNYDGGDNNVISQWSTEKSTSSSGYYYDLEDIKQLISVSSVDEIKGEEEDKSMYNYYYY